MRWIDTYFIELQPVAVDEALEGESEFVRRFETVERGQGWWVSLTHIGKNNSVTLDARISRMFDLIVKIATRRFGRLFETFARVVEQPAVKRAAQATVFPSAET